MSLAGPSGIPFHTKDVTFRQPSSEIDGRDVKAIQSATRLWQWKQLLNCSSDEFSTEYVNFDLPVLEIETIPADFKQ